MKRKLFIASTLITLMAVLHSPVRAQKKEKETEVRTSLSVTRDSWDDSDETRISYVEDGHRYKIRLKNSKITEMYVDDKKVPENEFSKYDPIVKKIMAQVEKDRVQAEKDRAQAEIDREQAEKDRAQADKDRVQAEKDRQQAEKDRDQFSKDRTQAERDREQAQLDRKQAERDREQAQRDREQAVNDRAQAERDREQAQRDRTRAEEDRKLMNSMIDELIKEKIIGNRDDLSSLELNETELIVNEKKQPDTLHSRFKTKYLKGEHGKIMYRNSGTSRNFSVN